MVVAVYILKRDDSQNKQIDESVAPQLQEVSIVASKDDTEMRLWVQIFWIMLEIHLLEEY